MLNIEDILKMTEEMGITVQDGTSGKHYILDDVGETIEFSTDMLMKNKKEKFSYELNSTKFKVNLEPYENKYNYKSNNHSDEVLQISVKSTAISAA